jgi:hypothetical protein
MPQSHFLLTFWWSHFRTFVTLFRLDHAAPDVITSPSYDTHWELIPQISPKVQLANKANIDLAASIAGRYVALGNFLCSIMPP